MCEYLHVTSIALQSSLTFGDLQLVSIGPQSCMDLLIVIICSSYINTIIYNNTIIETAWTIIMIKAIAPTVAMAEQPELFMNEVNIYGT